MLFPEPVGPHTNTIVATATTIYVGLKAGSGGGGVTTSFDNIVVTGTAQEVAPNSRKDILIAAANGDLYEQTGPRHMEKVISSATLDTTHGIQCAEYGQKSYIADWSKDSLAISPDALIADAGGGSFVKLTGEDEDGVAIDFVALETDIYSHVVVLYGSGAEGPTAGTYSIASVCQTSPPAYTLLSNS